MKSEYSEKKTPKTVQLEKFSALLILLWLYICLAREPVEESNLLVNQYIIFPSKKLAFYWYQLAVSSLNINVFENLLLTVVTR